MIDVHSKDRLAKVHPVLASKITALIELEAAKGFDWRVVQGLRTYAEQDALFAQGRTKSGQVVTKAKGGQSNHNFGLAVDICPFKNGIPQWNDNASFMRLDGLAEMYHLNWGGDWAKFIDKPHLELPGLTLVECRDLYGKGGLPTVWASPKLPKQ